MKTLKINELIIYYLLGVMIVFAVEIFLEFSTIFLNVQIDIPIIRGTLSTAFFMTILKRKHIKLFNFYEKISLKESINDLKYYFIVTFFAALIYHNVINLIDLRPAFFESFVESYVSNRYSIMILLDACLIGPIIEEIIFRGIALSNLKEAYSEKTGIIVSSVLFAIVHINPPQIILAFLLGLVLGRLYVKSNKLFNAMLLHIYWNSLIFLFTLLDSVVFE